ncbi:C4b-binding protein alpha chain-like isoform X2 [Narcine bancroftii]|uniref:C4b-binding protein alpha chain-like isoform X2 n=1 Tax=Narcine bancroftii TaxID=1343680 RepID=UPI00383145D1
MVGTGHALLFGLMLAAARTAGNCGRPPNLKNGSLKDAFISVSTFPPNTRVGYTCYPGYHFKEGSSSFITCRADSTWSTLQATCLPKSCGNPGDIQDGYYEADDVTFGYKATFYCNRGYKIIGRPYRLCAADGWDGKVPTCEGVKCPDPPMISHGVTPVPSHGEFWAYGMVAKFSCKADFSLIGARTLVCTETGRWDKKNPTCKIVRCNRPATPENGRTLSGLGSVFKFGDTIIYACNPGYVLVGESTVYCTENNKFQPLPPLCLNGTPVTPTTVTTLSAASLAGRNVGQQYGLLIILVFKNSQPALWIPDAPFPLFHGRNVSEKPLPVSVTDCTKISGEDVQGRMEKMNFQ